MTEPSADENLIEDALGVAEAVRWKTTLRDKTWADEQCNLVAGTIERMSAALLAAHRRNDQHVAAYNELAQQIQVYRDEVPIQISVLLKQRDSALRACADERERCAKVVEAAAEAQSVLAELRDSASANFIFYRMRRLEPAYQELSAALNALPLPALAGKQEMESEAGK